VPRQRPSRERLAVGRQRDVLGIFIPRARSGGLKARYADSPSSVPRFARAPHLRGDLDGAM
jgi:hypothetical protein